MSVQRYLIVNADDFGQTKGVNAGIIKAHENGIVTSASLMVRWPAAGEAARFAKAHPRFSIGLHVDLGEWAYRNGSWIRLYHVVSSDSAAEVEREIRHQLRVFQDLVGANPTHIDSHQHIHRDEPARSIVLELAREFDIPVRHFSSRVRYCGDFYGQSDEGEPFHKGISVENLERILSSHPEGTTELACHPGSAHDKDLDTQYLLEREFEVAALCHPAIKKTIERQQIILCSFHEVR